VLALPGGSVAEVVRPGLSGFICATPTEMGDKISEAAGLAPARVREYVERHFSLERTVERYAALYREILNEKSPRVVEDLDEEPRAIA
jgi:glycosyltransferase involved in cell wall biosynthesis